MQRTLPIYTPDSKTYNLRDYGLTPSLPEAFDSSMLSDWHDCKSYFYLRHILGLKLSGGQENADLAWGSRIHHLLHTYRVLRGDGQDKEEAAKNAVLEAAMEWPSVLDEMTDVAGRGQDRLLLVFSKYLAQWEEQERDIERLRQEQFFDIYCPPDTDCPYGGCDLRWSGRLDDMVRRKDKIVVWDYKTTRRMSKYQNDYWDRYRFSFQLPGYVWAAQHLLNEPVEGAVLDVLYTLKTKEDFFRRTFKYLPQQIKEWRYNVKATIQEIEWWYDNYANHPEMWPKDYNNCLRYRRCAYTDIHFTPDLDDTRLRIMEDDYVEDRWDPSDID